MAREAAVWFVMVGGQQDGPLTRAELGLRSSSGTLDAESPVWKEGMDEWLPSGEVPELAALFAPAKPAAKPPPYKPKPAAKPGAAKTALKPVSSATSKASSRSADRAASPVAKKAPEKGMGMSAFDTAHFRLADLPPKEEKGFGEGSTEFNTAHFRLADLPPKQEEKGFGEGSTEFNTAHFRLSDLPGKKDEGPLTLDTSQQKHAPGVVGYVDPKKPTPKAAAPATAALQSAPGKGKPPPKSSNPFPGADHQQQHEQLSDAVLGKARGGDNAADLAQWASSELSKTKASAPVAAAKASAPGKPVSVRSSPAAPVAAPDAKASSPGPGKPVSVRSAPAAPLSTPAAKSGTEESDESLLPQVIALGVGGLVLVGGVLWLIFG